MVKHYFHGPLNGGFQTGGFPDLGLSFLFCPFWDFPDFSGIFLICPGILRDFPDLSASSFSGPIKFTKSAWEEQSRKGPRHNPDLSRKKWKPPGLETPRNPVSFSPPKKKLRMFSYDSDRSLGARACVVSRICLTMFTSVRRTHQQCAY